jgi:hypothetical protein
MSLFQKKKKKKKNCNLCCNSSQKTNEFLDIPSFNVLRKRL